MDDTSDAIVNRAKAPVPSNVPPDAIYEIDMYALEGIEEGYHEAWKRVQQPHTPELIWTPFTGGHWIATRGEVIQEVYSDPTRFSSHVIWLPKEAGEKYALVPTRLDPPEHTPYRKALAKGLGIPQVRRMEKLARETASELIEGFLAKGRCDFPTDYAKIFPVKLFMAMADLPMADVPQMGRWVEQMTRPEGNTPEEMAECLDRGNRSFFDYVEPYVRARVGQSGDDLITTVVNTEIDGERMPYDMAIGLASLLLLGGLDTVVNFLSFMMLHLARHPDKVAELVAEPKKQVSGVEEMFRRFPVVAEGRMVARDLEYRGRQLKHGDMILVPTALHGLDDRVNANPMELDFSRENIAHSLFGGGPHRCAGSHLARMEIVVTLQEWLKRIPEFSLEPGARPIFHSGVVATVENVPLVWKAA
jgi:cytochrome P450